MEDAADTHSVLEYPVDLRNGVIRFLRSAVCHIIDMQYHFRHLPQQNPESTNFTAALLFSSLLLLLCKRPPLSLREIELEIQVK